MQFKEGDIVNVEIRGAQIASVGKNGIIINTAEDTGLNLYLPAPDVTITHVKPKIPAYVGLDIDDTYHAIPMGPLPCGVEKFVVYRRTDLPKNARVCSVCFDSASVSAQLAL